ncbi:MAG: nucleoside triphosphatase [Clostridiaceae bacterium]|nr:nucleoside triphosphatase [Clostridiaceae bacterium]
MSFENFPAELKSLPQWVVRRGKVPINPRMGDGAKAGQPNTWATFEEAVQASASYDGIGFEFHNNGVVGVDLDRVIDPETGIADPAALEAVERLNSYTEYSPSGTGLHIYVRGKIPVNGRKGGAREMYQAKRYFTVTGKPFGDVRPLADRSKEIVELFAEWFPDKSAPMPQKSTSSAPIDLSDAELITKIKRSKNGALFSALWDDWETSGYKSHSEADIALCNILAFWTGNDADRMDRLFRSSSLMRQKWDRRQSGSTYGAITIQNAISSTQQTYDPQALFKRKAAGITIGSASGPVKLADLHPEKNDRYGWSDIGNGNLFADWYKDIARYVPERKKWYVYTGKRWEPDTGNLHAMELCKKLADQLAIYALSLPEGALRDAYRKFVEKWQARKNRETILKDAASVRHVSLEVFDKEPYMFNCENGTLNLRTKDFHAHTPADMLSMISGVVYDPAAKSELWERVVNDCMQGDADKAVFLQKAMGYGLTGDTSEECFFLLYGATSRNGKGTVTDVYMKLQGDYGRTAKPDTIAQKQTANGSGPSDDIARLAGARVVNISEPDKKMVLSAALVKTLTGNDKITARFLHENSFEFYPQFKFFINTNYLPKVTDTTLFSSGRVKVIPFERHFSESEQDKGLKKELAKSQHLSGILNWCLEGLRLMQETGFAPPAAVLSATADYQRDSDKIARFIDDMMELNMIGEIRTEDAYHEYQSWCLRNGQAPDGMPTFKQSMGAYSESIVIKRTRPRGAGRNASPCWFICGVSWKTNRNLY